MLIMVILNNLLDNIKMQINYQFTFNLTATPIEAEQEPNIMTLFRDLFPYFKLVSISTVLATVQTIATIAALSVATVLPEREGKGTNVFIIVLRYLVWLIMLMRLGSECETRLGQKYYLSLIIIIQIQRLLLLLFWPHSDLFFMITNTPSLATLYIPATLNFKQGQSNEQMTEQQQKVVQNYDLLDLNDTVIKMRPMDMNYTYQSFTNRQFYHHNLSSRDEKAGKAGSVKKGGVKSKVNKIMSEQPQEYESGEMKIYKLIVVHFVIYSQYAAYEMFIFVSSEIAIYLVFHYKLLRKIWAKNDTT